MYEKLGKTAIRFSVAYLRRRYRSQIRLGVGLAALALGVGIYLASRNVPEG